MISAVNSTCQAAEKQKQKQQREHKQQRKKKRKQKQRQVEFTARTIAANSKTKLHGSSHAALSEN